MDVAELHSRALDATRGVIAGVPQGQWAAPTPLVSDGKRQQSSDNSACL